MCESRFSPVAALTVVATVLVVGNPFEARAQDRSRLTLALDSAAAAHAADSTVAGVAVAVVHRRDTLLLEGYGEANREFDVPTPADAVYEVGSITKQITAAAVLQLAARDSLDLDADITEYLEDYDTRGHPVTVQQLLHHTSGIRSYTNLAAFEALIRKDLPRDTLTSLIQQEPFRFAPGTAMSYSNSGYFLLGLIIEEASGQSYSEYLEEHLFGPAGMDASHYCDERAVVDHGAQGYSWSGESGDFVRKAYYDHTWPYAAGSLCSTAGDVVAWNQALHGGEILSDSSYREMTSPGQLSDGTTLRYGAGLQLAERDGYRMIGHGGGIAGFLSESRFYPEDDLIVVVLQNTTGPRGPQTLADSLARLVLGPGEKTETSDYEGDLRKLTGRYAGPSRGGITDLRIEVTDGELVARETGGDAENGRRLRHVSGLTWANEEERYTFVRAGDRIVELRLDVVGGHYVLRRVGEPTDR